MDRLLRFSINVISACGGSLSLISIYYSFSGQPRITLILMGCAMLIDSVDGTLIRSLGIKNVLPEYDGTRLDEYADLITFVLAPICFAWGTGLLPVGVIGLITGGFICVVSSLQFSYRYAKTDVAFLGFPSYWNLLFFYGWAFTANTGLMIGLSWFLGLAIFLPIPFIYPSKTPRFRLLTVTLGLIWGAMLFYYILFPSAPWILIPISLFYPAYYTLLSFYLYPKLG